MTAKSNCPFCKQDELTQWVASLEVDMVECAIMNEVSKVKKSKRVHLERHIRNVITAIKKDRQYYDKRLSLSPMQINEDNSR